MCSRHKSTSSTSLQTNLNHLTSSYHPVVIAMASPIPRFLLPKGSLLPRNRLQFPHRDLLQARQPTQPCRRVTGSAAAKPSTGPRKNEVPEHAVVTRKQLVLERPDKFRPPSHGRRLKEQVPRNYGPELTKEQKVEQKTKQYPNMFPPEGTFMHWFLTNNTIHTCITIVSTTSPLVHKKAFVNILVSDMGPVTII